MSIRLKTVMTGALSFVPGVMPLYRRVAFRPNPAFAENSYGVWLKHLALSYPYRREGVPRIVVELGPGLSLGAGLAALICGAERYIALDAMRFVQMAQVLPVFDRLVALLRQRTQPDNATGFPPYEAVLDASGFPSQMLPASAVAGILDEERVARLRRDVQAFVESGGVASRHIDYIAPWCLSDVPCCGEVDFLFSHTVLQYVPAPDEVWKNMGVMLCHGGVGSHQVDFSSQNISDVWNGHWACSEWAWRIALGRKSFLINRKPLSWHLGAAANADFTVEQALRLRDVTGIRRQDLAPQWRGLADDDLVTRGALMVVRRR